MAEENPENPSIPPTPGAPAPAAGTPAPGAAGGIERLCLEALKGIGKTLGQMALYKVGHPAVAETIQSAQTNLTAALAGSGTGELVVSLDGQKLIANGRMVGAVSQLPNAIANLFTRFKLSSLTFRSGVTHEELSAFCELAASRSDSPQAADPTGYLASRGVSRIALNEAVYTKSRDASTGGAGAGAKDGGAGPGAGEGEGAGAGAGAGQGGAAAAAANPEDQIREISEALQSASLERTLMALVAKAVPDPVLRQKVLQQVMKLLEQDIAKRVEEVTTPLKRDKQGLENERARTESVLSGAVEGVVVVDEQGKILMMNPAAEQVYGASLAQAAGKPITDKASEQLVVTLASEIETPVDRGIKTEIKVQGADEAKRTLRASSAVVKTEEGKVVGMVSALPDTTKHKELQKMQRDFVAHVTHELRAPLSSIKAALEILQGQFAGKIEDEETRMLNTALKNSDRLAEMINSILDFSKIESGQMTVYPKPADPLRIAQEAVDSLQPWAQKKRITLSLTAPEGLPIVSSDSGRTVQVIINLLSNAIKFTPAGGRITVSLAKKAVNGEFFIEFSVADTGSGIPKAEQARVFEKFVQIAAGEQHVGGTGLGLSIAKALVHLQGGQMRLESDAGKGATFFFTLPVHTAQAVEASSIRTKTKVEESAPWWKKLLGLK